MSTQEQSSNWPANAVPEAWVERLFGKLSAYFGSRLADMWRNTEIDEVKREWGMALAKLSQAELKAGVSALISLKYPPTLPEFHGLCKQIRLAEMPRVEALTDQTRADAQVVEANMQRVRASVAPLLQPQKITAEWAYQVLMRGESRSGKPLTYEVIRCCSDAISSSAGRTVIEECDDAELRSSYQSIRNAIVDAYRSQSKPMWEVR